MTTLPTFDAPPNGALSEEMLTAYRDAGVIALRGFVPVEKCQRLRQRALQLVDEFDPAEVRSVFSTTEQTQLDDRYFIDSGDKIRFFLESGAFDDDGHLRQSKEQSLNKMGHAMHDLDPVFDEFSRTPELAEVVKRLGIRDPGILQSMYIFKPPRIGGEVVWHQDSTYIYTEPESCIGFWFALEDATIGNGCLYFIPGAHRTPLKYRNYRVSDRRVTTELVDDRPWPDEGKVAAEAAVGTLVIFSGRAPHYSGPNLSAHSRHAYTLHVIDKTCRYPENNWLQRSPDMPLRGFT
ncbi:MAG: phytanoyl-CoA dioxygenase family protein [Gammaproteobacteria bacterium]|nr:phytanoyl-CoA dioxygenase family protein [Gammaproteobacteria bacterium]